LNGIHHLQIGVEDVDIVGGNINTLKKNTDFLLDVSMKVGCK
jgi:hypothetical protein